LFSSLARTLVVVEACDGEREGDERGELNGRAEGGRLVVLVRERKDFEKRGREEGEEEVVRRDDHPCEERRGGWAGVGGEMMGRSGQVEEGQRFVPKAAFTTPQSYFPWGQKIHIQSPSWSFDRGIQRKERARTRGEAFDDESDLIFSPSSFTDTSRSLRNRISLKF